MIRIIDFVMCGITIYLACLWTPSENNHATILAFMIGFTSLISYIRGSVTR